MKRTSRLLAQADGHERDMSRRRPMRAGRILTWTVRLATLAVMAVLAVNAWFAWDIFVGDGEAPSPTEPSYGDLQVFDNAGTFGGTIEVRNPTAYDVEMMVTVDLYDGDQNVGDMSGMMTMKPGSEAVMELDGYDDFVDYTEARVDLDGFPI